MTNAEKTLDEFKELAATGTTTLQKADAKAERTLIRIRR